MKYLAVALPLVMSGCAGVSFNQLNPNLTSKSGAPEGAVYYLPKPILIVTVDSKEAAVAPVQQGHVAPPLPAPALAKKMPVAPPPVPAPALAGGADDDKPAAAPTASGTDQSYSVSVPGYTLKLVYVPDLSRPMRLSVHAGLGTASLKPTLQNGWMLSGFDAAADSKAAEMLASVAQLVTAANGPKTAAAGAVKGGAADSNAEKDTNDILRAGLYDFDYDVAGILHGICALSYFSGTGSAPATDAGSCMAVRGIRGAPSAQSRPAP
jgi:hypothetical protein